MFKFGILLSHKMLNGFSIMCLSFILVKNVACIEFVSEFPKMTFTEFVSEFPKMTFTIKIKSKDSINNKLIILMFVNYLLFYFI